VSLSTDLYLIEGMCAVLSQLNHFEGYKQMLSPIVGRLSTSLRTSTSDSIAVNADVDRITCALMYIEFENEVIVQVFSDIFPILQTVLMIYNGENTCEKVCRCYKHVVRITKKAFVPLLPQLLEHLVERFQMVPVSAFIYGVSACVTNMANLDNGAHVEVLYNAVWRITTVFFSHLTSFESFEKKPDLVEEYYYMMTKVLQNCPIPFVEHPGVETIIQAGKYAGDCAYLFCC
jgi:transportin-3